MNYKKHYNLLVGKCNLRGLDKSRLDIFTERHHIIPRCLGGGNEDVNIVLVTGREHFILHRLISKANPSSWDLAYAVTAFQMCKTGQRRGMSTWHFNNCKLLGSKSNE